MTTLTEKRTDNWPATLRIDPEEVKAAAIAAGLTVQDWCGRDIITHRTHRPDEWVHDYLHPAARWQWACEVKDQTLVFNPRVEFGGSQSDASLYKSMIERITVHLKAPEPIIVDLGEPTVEFKFPYALFSYEESSPDQVYSLSWAPRTMLLSQAKAFQEKMSVALGLLLEELQIGFEERFVQVVERKTFGEPLVPVDPELNKLRRAYNAASDALQAFIDTYMPTLREPYEGGSWGDINQEYNRLREAASQTRKFYEAARDERRETALKKLEELGLVK